MKKMRLLPLFLIAPLFMANAPAPARGPDLYEDFAISNLTSISHDTETNRRVYSVSVTNTGDGYISVADSEIRPKKNSSGNSITFRTDELVIAPHQTYDISFFTFEEVTLESVFPAIRGYSSDFEVKEAATFSNFSAITEEENETGYNGELLPSKYYTYSFSCKYKKNTDEFGIHYAPIFHFSDGDNDYYFHEDILANDYRISTALDLDVSKLQLIDYTFIEGYEYYRIRGINEVAVSTFMWVMLAVFVFSVPVVVVVGGLVVLIIFIVKRKKNRGESQEPASDNIEDNSEN